jgi:hypothetical protein
MYLMRYEQQMMVFVDEKYVLEFWSEVSKK